MIVGTSDYTYGPFDLGSETCTDEYTSPGIDHPFTLNRTSRLYGTSNGRVSGAYRVTGWPYGGNINHGTVGSVLPTTNDTFLRHKAASNPSVPRVDLSVFLYELKDLPGMLYEGGIKRLLGLSGPTRNRPGSNSVAAVNFGWDPLLRDLASMVNIVPMIDQRFQQLKSTHGVPGWSPKAKTWNDVRLLANSVVYPFSGYMGAYRIELGATTTARRWASLRWRANPANFPETDDELYSKARDLVLGRSQGLTLSSIWEAMPWSWFVDYFTNIGDLLKSSRNAIGCYTSNQCVMTTTETRVWFNRVISNPYLDATFALADPHRVTKERVVIGSLSFPELRLPILSARQVLTLSSIFANRAKWSA